MPPIGRAPFFREIDALWGFSRTFRECAPKFAPPSSPKSKTHYTRNFRIDRENYWRKNMGAAADRTAAQTVQGKIDAVGRVKFFVTPAEFPFDGRCHRS
jgi:hypothetical protein